MSSLDSFTQYYNGLMDDLKEHKIHTTAFGKKIEIKNMGDEHLKNSLKYSEHKKDEYWDIARPMFEMEIAKRGI